MLAIPELSLQDDSKYMADDEEDTSSEKSFQMQVTLSKMDSFELRPQNSNIGKKECGHDMDENVHLLVRATSSMHLSFRAISGTNACMGCEEADAEVFCRDCGANYCASCDKQTHSLRNRLGHVRVAAQGTCSLPVKCVFHHDRPCEYFCNTCSQAVCELCKDYGMHQAPGHDVVSVCVLANGVRATVLAEAAAVQAILDGSTAAVASIEQALVALESGEQAGRARESINQMFIELERAAQCRCAALTADLEEDAEWRRGGLSHQQSLLQNSVATGAEVLEKCAAALDESGGHADLVSALDAVDKYFEATNPVMKYTEPVERSDIDVCLDGDILTAIRSHGAVGGPNHVTFAVQADGNCLVSWSPPLEPQRSDAPLVSYDVRLLLLRPGEIEPHSLDLGMRAVVMDEESLCELSMSVNLRSYPSCSVGFCLRAVYGTGRRSAWATVASLQQLPDHFVVKSCMVPEGGSPFSQAGLFYVLGTDLLASRYSNPHESGAVLVTWSSVGSGSVHHFVAHRDPYEHSYTDNVELSWMAVDIGAEREFRPFAYSLRHDQQGSRGVLRNWALQGSRDGIRWATLSTHFADTSLEAVAGSEALFFLPPTAEGGSHLDEEGYRHFRILQTGKNSTGKYRLACAGFELYGILC